VTYNVSSGTLNSTIPYGTITPVYPMLRFAEPTVLIWTRKTKHQQQKDRSVSIDVSDVGLRYDTIRYVRRVYLTCSKKPTDSQLSLPHGLNKTCKVRRQESSRGQALNDRLPSGQVSNLCTSALRYLQTVSDMTSIMRLIGNHFPVFW